MRPILIDAGESSGDLHGAGVAVQLRALHPGLAIYGTGGKHMAEAGVEILHDATRHATVGLFEAVRNLGQYARLYRKLVSFARRERPSVVVLVDLPDFNLKFGGYVHRLGIPIVGGIAIFLISFLSGGTWQQKEPETYQSLVVPIGNALLKGYLLPFEIISIVLLGALVGAVVIVRREVK